MLDDLFTERFFRHVNAVVNGTEVIDRIEAASQRSRHIVMIARSMTSLIPTISLVIFLFVVDVKS